MALAGYGRPLRGGKGAERRKCTKEGYGEREELEGGKERRMERERMPISRPKTPNSPNAEVSRINIAFDLSL
jgi:hypothetical protein